MAPPRPSPSRHPLHIDAQVVLPDHINPARRGLAAAARDWPHSTFAEQAARGVYEPHWAR